MRKFGFPPAVSDSRSWLVVVGFVLFVACGGGGGGSDSGSGADALSRQLLVRWREDSSVAGYVIHWGMSSQVYTDARDVGAPTPDTEGVVSYELDVETVGGTIFVALTSYDADGHTSAFSNELAATVD